MNNFYKIHYIVFFLALFFSKSIAEPTVVRSKAVEQVTINTGYNNMALTFNNDGTKMYTSSMKAVTPADEARDDKVYEYVLTTANNISTATLRTSINVGTYTYPDESGDDQTSSTALHLSLIHI